MKKLFTLLVLLLSISAFGKTKKITVSSDEGTHIFINGKEMGESAMVVVKNNGEIVHVRVEKIGFVTAYRDYGFTKSKSELPDEEYIQLKKDKAYENSSASDVANKDIEVKTTLPEVDAWKLLNRVVTDYFDVVEITDKETGYLRTAWVVKKFNGGIVRTRLIVKTGGTTPLSYKLKIISEIAPPDAISTQDESFKNWDRLLRAYENAIPEIQSRLSK